MSDSVDELPLDKELIATLQKMLLAGVLPADILRYLQSHITDRLRFTAYMEAACPDDECDEGKIWLVATRWWRGDTTVEGANVLLTPVFEAARQRWMTRQQWES